MAILYNSVKPGEVITADVMNYLLDQLNLMDQRVTKLETGGSQVGQTTTILGFDPPNQIPAGRVLSIKGANFAFPPTDNAVTIDDTPISVFRQDSTGSELNFIVPTSITPPPSGKNVTITVRNKVTSQSFSALYRIMPVVQAPGNPPVITNVVPVDPNSPLIRIDQPLRITGQNFAATPAENLITFTVKSSTDQDVVYPKQGQTLTIDAIQTNTSQIVVKVPDMAEVPAGVNMTPVTLKIGVGAQVPALRVIQVNRF